MTDFNLFLRAMCGTAILSRSSNADVLGRQGIPSEDAVFEVVQPGAVDARFHEQHRGHHGAHARLAVDEDVTFSRKFSHGFDDLRMRHEEAAAVSGHAGVLLSGANVEDEGAQPFARFWRNSEEEIWWNIMPAGAASVSSRWRPARHAGSASQMVLAAERSVGEARPSSRWRQGVGRRGHGRRPRSAAFRILATAQQNLDGEGGLHRSEHAGHSAQHANFVTGLDRAGWWRVGMKVLYEAPVAGSKSAKRPSKRCTEA